jgi:hypothetical protein
MSAALPQSVHGRCARPSPLACLHAVASFYVKAAWSPDGSHILSGSTDRCAYVWEVGGGWGWGLSHPPRPALSGTRPTLRPHCHGAHHGLQVDAPDGASPYVLSGHQGEVTAVAWCPSDFHQARGARGAAPAQPKALWLPVAARRPTCCCILAAELAAADVPPACR